MSITRIKNNQITDLTVNAAAKLQDYSITSGKIANNLTYNSNLTIAGNLDVTGQTTTIDTVDLVVEDPLILLAKNQTGTPALDIGFIGKRGTEDNIAFVWDESAGEFVTAFTTSEVTNTVITINSYASFRTANLTAANGNITGNLSVGNISFVGNIDGNLNVTGNVSASNFLTTGTVSATGTGTFGNVATGGTISSTGTATLGNVATSGTVSATGTATLGNVATGGTVSATGNITGGNVNTVGQVSATGNVTGGNLTTSGNIDGTNVNITGVFANTISATGTATVGNLATAGTVSATGTGTFSNVATGGTVSATGTVTGGNLATGGTISATGNIDGGNINTIGTISSTGTATLGNVATGGTVSATGTVTGGDISTGGNVSATGNVTSGNVLTGGEVSATGNITTDSWFVGNLDGNLAAPGSNTNILFNDDGIANATAGLTFDKTANALVANGNISGTNFNTTGVVTATGNVTGGNINTGGVVTATGNVVGGNLVTGGVATVTGNVIGGNINTAGVVSATGNVVGGNLVTAGAATVTGNVTGGNINTAGVVSAGGNVQAGNLRTAGEASVTGNITTAATLLANTVSSVSGDLVLTGTNLQWDGSGNILMNGQWINNLSDPVQAQDAATKEYVDNAVSTGITIHTPVRLEANSAIGGTYAQGGTTATVTDTIAGNTVVFSSAINPQPNDQLWFTNSFNGIVGNTPYFVVSAPNTSAAVLSRTYSGAPVTDITNGSSLTEAVRINSGQGATLTNNGANATLVIDGVTTVNGDRVLIYSEANAVHNGVYVVSEAGNATTAWQLTRSSDMDTYKPDDVNGLDAGDYFYVQEGDSGAGESYVITAPIGPTIIGYDPLTFTQFSASQVYTANTAAGLDLTGTVFSAKVDNDTTAFDGGGNIVVKAGANLTTPNIGAATGTSLSLTGNVTAGNISAVGNVNAANIVATEGFFGNIDLTGDITVNSLTSNTFVSAVGNVVSGNVETTGLISATGNVTGGNLNTGGVVSATGNVDSGNVNTTGVFSTTVSASGNVTGGNVYTTGIVTATGTITGGNVATGGTVSATGNVTGGNVNTGGSVSATGNVDSGNVNTTGVFSTTVSATGTATVGNVATGGTVSATGNVTGGNINTAGQVSATGNITGGNLLYGSGDVSGTGNVFGNNASFTGNVTAANFIGNISGNIDAAGNVNEVQFNGAGDILAASANFTFDPATSLLTVTGNIAGANLTTGGVVTATGNVTGGNINTGGVVTATGNVTGGNITTAGQVTATGNVTGGNLVTAGIATVTGNVIGGNINTAGEVTATGTITGGNLITTGDGNIGNIRISGDDITSVDNLITFNAAGADVDFAVSGDTVANVFYIDAGLGTAAFGNSGAITNAIVSFNTTDSIKFPVGNIAQRPDPATIGMVRFSSTADALEVYTSGGWENVGVPEFTVITADEFTGDGSTLQFTLSEDSTTAATIVSINGVVQQPVTAYAVSGNVLTFTEAPESTDTIDARILTTTTTVTQITNVSANAVVAVSDTTNDVLITGDLLPISNLSGNLGSSTQRWDDLYLSGNTIFLGSLQLKEINATTFGVFQSDGVTTADLDVGNIDVAALSQGTSTIGIAGINGNAYVTVAGTANVAVVNTGGVVVTGNISATGNVTAQDVNSLSDATLKTNINPLIGVESVINSLTGVEYDWKNGSGHSYGFLAQEVEKVLPAAVKTGADGLKSINYMMIIPFLVETIKQLGAEVADLKKKLD